MRDVLQVAFVEIKQVFKTVYLIDGKLATLSLAPGKRVYGEKIVPVQSQGVPEDRGTNGEYRVWDLFRSKLAGAIKKGLGSLEIAPGSKVLYLGAGAGTTASHISDIVGKGGEVYCVEFAQRSLRDLVAVCESRPNMFPILADARKPQDYSEIPKVDAIYQDVAQPDQAQILIKNSQMFLKKGGIAYLCVKSQSIDVTARPQDVFAMVKKQLGQDFDVMREIELAPYDYDHLFLALRKK